MTYVLDEVDEAEADVSISPIESVNVLVLTPSFAN